MKKAFYLLSVFFVFAFTQCEDRREEKKKEMVMDERVHYLLDKEWIFTTDCVRVALKRITPEQKTEGRKHFMSGLDLLMNKNNPEASIEFFKEALSFYPDEKSYLFLFRAYMQISELELAKNTNIVYYDFGNLTEAMFNDALVAAVGKDTVNCINNLQSCIQYGFSAGERIEKEPLFEFIHNNQTYQGMMVKYFGNDEIVKKRLFASFVNSFTEMRLPYTIPVDSVAAFNYDKFINYDFAAFIPGMEDERFARMVSQEYMAMGRFKTNNGMAVIYKSIELLGDTLLPVSTSIITYDSLGTIISNSVIACFCSPLERTSCIINTDLSIEMSDHKVEWEKDPLESGYRGNRVSSVSESGRKRYQVNIRGEVVEAKEPEGAMAVLRH